jgi:hypothetical protein
VGHGEDVGAEGGLPEMEGMATVSESRAMKAGAEASMYERSSGGADIELGGRFGNDVAAWEEGIREISRPEYRERVKIYITSSVNVRRRMNGQTKNKIK